MSVARVITFFYALLATRSLQPASGGASDDLRAMRQLLTSLFQKYASEMGDLRAEQAASDRSIRTLRADLEVRVGGLEARMSALESKLVSCCGGSERPSHYKREASASSEASVEARISRLEELERLYGKQDSYCIHASLPVRQD